MADDELTALLIEEHQEIFGADLDEARVLRQLRYEAAIPQLLPDHPERVEALRGHLGAVIPGLSLAGNYLTGVGIEAAVESGYTAAARAASQLAGDEEEGRGEA